ncbi:hypothetical protein XELAEV_18039121mg [Xenopus laevis]|uniref:Uncharacterized protein n=1 Tax=Xenopus laevis TaxID=8355 RepID=A0A974H7J3_XENLA|nr:hypothetical protein XELAEV_18039121mg [Xenopus laevis]
MDSNSSDSDDPSSPLLPPSSSTGEDDEDAFEILSRTTQSPDLLPWEQRSLKTKIMHVADRIFLIFLAVFLLVLFGEIMYIVYHAVPWAELSQALKNQLLLQDEGEEELDL